MGRPTAIFLNKGDYGALSDEERLDGKDGADYCLGYALVNNTSELALTLASDRGYLVKLIQQNDVRP